MTADNIEQACNIIIEDDLDVGIWTATHDFNTSSVGECVRAALTHLDGKWAFELHQYLANTGNSILLYRLNRDHHGAMPLSMGKATGPFGTGLALETAVSSEERIQLGVSMLTAFVVTISQGTHPTKVSIDDLGRQIRELQLPVA